MLTKSNHSYHLIDQRPWPLFASLATLIVATGLSKWFSLNNHNLFLLGLSSLLLISYMWWRDVTRESTFQGLHTQVVINGLRWGMILFITSEILFFFSFFWAFFHRRLSPTLEIGLTWPPLGITPFNATQVPLLNTLILLSSGVSITWSHHALIENNFTHITQAIILTVILGIYFTALQAVEYLEASFCIADSVYGATFFCGDWFPWSACFNWDFISYCYLFTNNIRTFLLFTSFRVWGSRLILTLCWRSMTFPLFKYLLMR